MFRSLIAFHFLTLRLNLPLISPISVISVTNLRTLQEERSLILLKLLTVHSLATNRSSDGPRSGFFDFFFHWAVLQVVYDAIPTVSAQRTPAIAVDQKRLRGI